MSLPEPAIDSFFDPRTNTICHLVTDAETSECCVIDPVLDFDAASARTSTEFIDEIIGFIEEKKLNLVWILETHAHADHISSAQYLKSKAGGRIGVGQSITQVQSTFARMFNFDATVATDGSQFDHLFHDEEVFQIGQLDCRVWATPGHTPACVTYLIGSHAFVGDTLFMPDYGTARCDFPGGDAAVLYQSIQRLLGLPEQTMLHMCHDYMPGGREPKWQCTVAEARDDNIHIGGGVSQTAFVEMRKNRDATLNVPALLIPSIQLNVRAGLMPEAEENGVSYLKTPLNVL